MTDTQIVELVLAYVQNEANHFNKVKNCRSIAFSPHEKGVFSGKGEAYQAIANLISNLKPNKIAVS